MCKEYINIQTGNVLDLKKVSNLKSNTMLKSKPETWCNWDFEKNKELGLDIWKLTFGSDKKAFWICEKCDSIYNMKINSRVRGNKCTYCSRKNVNYTNSLASLNPKLASEWHPTKNGDLIPSNVTLKSNKKVWWICEKGHEWEAKIFDRNSGNGCSYCSSQKVLKGYNDMWTTNPKLASLLVDSKHGYIYTESSNMKVDWKCSCGKIIKEKSISNIRNYGLSCPICSKGKSKPEKIMISILKQLEIDFECEKRFEWLRNKRYDFYIPSLNTIIEVHGSQHYGNDFKLSRGRTSIEETINDELKKEMALKNGISEYIVIDAKRSEFKYIKKSIENSGLSKMLNLESINFKEVFDYCNHSNTNKIMELWNDNYSVSEIEKETEYSKSKIRRVLKDLEHLGLCNYKEEYRKRNTCGSKKVSQFNTNGEVIKIWNSMIEASNVTGIAYTGIVSCCTGRQKTSGGYLWKYA